MTDKSTADERFWKKVQKTEACWIWTGAKDGCGYGHFWGQTRMMKAHRWSYERFVGPIPAGLNIDHLCRTPSCVNPSHLEPVTQRENLLRGDTFQARNVRKTHCSRGHLLAGDNLKKTPGHRQCRECSNVSRQASHAQAKLRSQCTCSMFNAPGHECPVHGEAP